VAWLLLALLLSGTAGCLSDSGGKPLARDPADQTETQARTETADMPQGMPEGINETFLDEDMDVSAFVERFEGESRAVFAERLAITQSLGLEPGDHIADIGAGTGFFTALFDAEVGPEGTTYAVEISPQFLEHLRGRTAAENLDTVEVVEGTMTSVELPRNSIDTAFICDVYHHFESPDATLASLFDAIRPGGELILIEFERIPGVTPDWLIEHVRAGREVFRAEIESAGFVWKNEIKLSGLDDNYIFRFERPATAAP
jgi:SAM-dependent methyltransferase